MSKLAQIPIGAAATRLLLQTLTGTCPRCKREKTTTLDKAYYLCSACRHETRPREVLDINALDPLDPVHNDQQFDRQRDLEERGLTEQEAYQEEHPHSSGTTRDPTL